jgi:hypothetical protein
MRHFITMNTMLLTKDARLNSSRFGCAFLPKENLICVPWQQDAQSARSAEVQLQILFSQYPSAPLLSLAFQISRSKVLPYYCYVPFNMRSEVHVKCLSGILKTGKVEVCFLTRPRSVLRTHEIPPAGRTTMSNLLETAVAYSNSIPEGSYDFEQAVGQFEQKVRLPDFFQYVVTAPELRQVIEAFKRDGAKASPAQKEQAAKIATEVLAVFSPKHDGLVHDFTKQIPSIRRSLLFISDLHDHFQNDFDGFRHFVVDAIASYAPQEENLQLEGQLPILELLLNLLEHMRKPDVSAQQAAARDADLRDLANRIINEGLSLEKMKNLASLFGFQGGQPGRPPKDYSEEYELRAKGGKWREVAEHAYRNDPDLRQEFGVTEYRQLRKISHFRPSLSRACRPLAIDSKHPSLTYAGAANLTEFLHC